MAKPRIPNQKKQYQLLNRRLAAYMAAVRRIYGELGSEAARIAASAGYEGKKPFVWKDYPRTKARVQQLQERFVSQLGSLIMSGTSDEWRRSNLHQDLIVDKVLKAYHTSRKDSRNERYYRDNSEALQAFQQRKERGMNLSDKLWGQSQSYREELQDVISVAIERGTDAITLSKQVSKYLQDFPSMQRDYKELYGKASKAQDCEYRSIRLARSEINMAYRTAEQQRWRQLDFVVGYEIKMSGAHPAHDVCDELEGKYPKDFKWNGWHPNCMCYEIPILKTEDEFYGESDDEEPEVKGKVDAEMVEEKLDIKKTMFETHDVFKYELHPEDRAAVESFADRLGRFNPKGEVISFGIDDVVQTQKYVGTQNVIQIAQSIEKDGLQDNPTGIKVGDKVFIVDGHNRIAAMRLGGSNTFDIRVVEVSEEEWKSAGGQVPEGGFISSKRLGSASINEVTDVPMEFKDWVQNNIQRAKSWSTAPFFIQDNTQYVSEEFKVGVYTDEERKFVRKGRTALAMSHIEYLHQLHPEIREVELAAINAYTQPVGPTNRNATSREINRRLRNETEDSYVDIASELISRGIAQLPRVTGEVYRGETMSEAKLKSLYLDNVGQTIRIKSFVSTSTDMDVAEQFISHDGVRKSHKRIILHIYSKNGREIFDISEFNGIFADKNQHECLFDKGTVFYVSPDIEEVNGVIHIKLNEV